MAKFTVTWSAPEFEYREKTVSWYWKSIIIATLLVAFAVWTSDFLFGFFIVIAEILLIVWGNKEPRIVDFELTEAGLTIDDKNFQDLSRFGSWSVDTADHDEWADIVFHFRSRLRPGLFFMVPRVKVEAIRSNLRTIMREVEYQPTIADAMEKFVRF